MLKIKGVFPIHLVWIFHKTMKSFLIGRQRITNMNNILSFATKEKFLNLVFEKIYWDRHLHFC